MRRKLKRRVRRVQDSGKRLCLVCTSDQPHNLTSREDHPGQQRNPPGFELLDVDSCSQALTILDQRLTTLANSDAIDALPDILRVPLSEPLFILGTLFILVVLFLPGGLTGTAQRLARRRTRRGDRVQKSRDILEEAA